MRDAVIHVLDDDEPARESLAFLLRMEGFQVRAHASPRDFLDEVGEGAPGRTCLVTDLAMPEMNGIALLRHLRQHGVAMPTIVATGHADDPLAVEAMRAGAADCLQKPYDADELLQAIAAVLEPVEGQMQERRHDLMARMALLTPCEATVLKCLLKGKSVREVAAKLGSPAHDVEMQRAGGMRKLGVSGFVDLVRTVFRLPPGSTPLEPR